MIKFTKERVLTLYKIMVDKIGGAFGIKDNAMLESALEAPYQTFGGEELFPTLIEKGARLGYGLVSNHPFIDGNKRIGLLVMLTFFEVHDIKLDFTNKEIEHIIMRIADGSYKYEDLLDIIKRKLG